MLDDGPCGIPLGSKYGQSMRLVVTTSVSPSQWPLDRPSNVFGNASTFDVAFMLIVRTVSYSSRRSRIVSPLFTNSIGYGSSMIVGMPFGRQPGATLSVRGLNAARAFFAASVNG